MAVERPGDPTVYSGAAGTVAVPLRRQLRIGTQGGPMAIEIDLDINNPTGLHARPAAVFVRAACGFRSDIRVANVSTGSPEVTAKSMIAVLSLGAGKGHRIRIRLDGEDEAVAAATLSDLVAGGLGETDAVAG